jgi:hypothetical protein
LFIDQPRHAVLFPSRHIEKEDVQVRVAVLGEFEHLDVIEFLARPSGYVVVEVVERWRGKEIVLREVAGEGGRQVHW